MDTAIFSNGMRIIPNSICIKITLIAIEMVTDIDMTLVYTSIVSPLYAIDKADDKSL